MKRTLHFGAIAFIIAASLLWAWQQVLFTRNASPHAKAACHGVGSSFWERRADRRINRHTHSRHHRACPGDPRLHLASVKQKTWMAGTSPAMTS
ncbi:MAG: hypothetical protein Q7V17_05640 [Afipia sp.]|nr:hypothetical protein [Afipia sp.]